MLRTLKDSFWELRTTSIAKAKKNTRTFRCFSYFSFSEMKELMEYMARHHDDLLKTMTDEQKEIFEKFDDCWSEYMSLAEAAIFTYAFKLGMQIAIETLTE